ncbi:MAG: hypothetical protein JWP95_212, partial [Actinotalea sp.]|nr:hypothetical protein [Actinotalea sp.]
MRVSRVVPRSLAGLVTGALVAASLTVLTAPAAQADTAPVDPALPTTVTADSLPTVQINGVVWNQQIVGNTVYVAGNFTSARPAGSPAGTNETPRSNMLAYNLTTGALITSFAPTFNGQVKDLAVSPDGTTLYAAGLFTTVNGQNRYRVAAFDVATGALSATFRPTVNSSINAVAATNTTVFIGGSFSTVNAAARNKVAAVSAATGATQPLSADIPDGGVLALVAAPDESSVVIGGSFTSVNGSSAPGYGLARLDLSGASLPLPVNDVARNGGSAAAILNLETDGVNFYGSGYHFGGAGNVEGTFAGDWATGGLVWIEDCHGDTYAAFPAGGAVYQASHKHYCGNSGAFPQTDPWTYYRGTAVSKAALGTNTPDIYGYPDHPGRPAPRFLNWYPTINAGTFTGKTQGPWTVHGNDTYVLMGGEFTTVNGVGQQGLARFGTSAVAPDLQGPRLSGDNFPINATSFASGTVRLSWKANYDRDNETLTYRVYRTSMPSTPIYEQAVTTPFWKPVPMGFMDEGLAPGSTQRYRLTATDAFNNVVSSNWTNVVVSADGEMSDYATEILEDDPSAYWRLGEASGPTIYDWAGWSDATAGTGITRGAAGAINGDPNTASTFDGTGAASFASPTPVPGPDTFTVETWVRTTSTQGGKLIGFGNVATGSSSNYDRHVYMDNAGRIWFGVHPGGVRTVNSASSYNDGQWHHVVASLGADGMKLYVDGKRVGARGDVTSGQGYSGYWRVGGDNINGWTERPSSDNLAGVLDDVAVYGTVLTHDQVLAHYTTSGRTSPVPPVPADAYGAAVRNEGPDLYWRLGESSGTQALDTSVNGVNGTYYNGAALGQTGALAGETNTAVAFDGNAGMVSSDQSFNNPRTYSEELWFKTTSTSGGKLIGFGTAQTGTSGGYDRHVYMDNSGTLTFGVWTGFTNTITTATPYNDGQWHHVVATQSPTEGMRLYVDGALAGTNGQTEAQDYTGYWRIGGDNHWGCCSPFLAGTIDEVAVYSHVLTPSVVANHYALGTSTPAANQAPTASFTAGTSSMTVSVDGSGSTDPDGTIASYSWSWGDGSPAGSGATASHPYAAGGTYSVTLTVTDDDGATATSSQDVTVVAPPVNQAPTASFTVATSPMTVDVDGSGSTDPDGTIASYSWSWGDGSPAGSGATASHPYAAVGNYTVTLTVTDDDGATATSSQVVAIA